MLTNKNPQNLREFHLDLCDVKTTADAFTYALKMMLSLKHDFITNKQYELLAGSLELHCKAEGIRTKNEIASLF
jgi:hypothetical protein